MAESVRQAEILEKAKQLREELRKEDNTRGLVSNISEDDPMTVDNTTPVPEALDTADESPITTHAEFFKKNFVFGSRIESPKRCELQDIAAINNPVDSSCHNSLHSLDEAIADGDTTPDRAVQDSNSGIISQRLADGNQSMHSTASPTATKHL